MTTDAPQPLTNQELHATAFWGSFGARFRAARLAAGYTMEALAEAVGIDARHLWHYQQNRFRPRYTAIVRICQALDICPTSLFPPLEEWYTPAQRGAWAASLPLSRLCHDPLCWTALL